MAIPIELEDHSDQLRVLNEWLELDPRQTALITIDMHKGHLDPVEATLPVPAEVSASVRTAARELLQFAREEGMPVIHAILTWRPEEAYRYNARVTASRLVPSHYAPITDAQSRGVVHNLEGSIQCQLMPELGPEPTDYLLETKKTLSIYYGTPLEIMLNTYLKCDTVLLMGINTNTCVQCAAFESLNRGYKTVVVRDGVGSMYGQDLHEFALQNIARCLGWVLTVEEIRQKLRSAASVAIR